MKSMSESERIQKAKKWAHKMVADAHEQRRWLVSPEPIPDSYGDSTYRVTVEVLEGSPPCAILISTRDWTDVVMGSGHRRLFRGLM